MTDSYRRSTNLMPDSYWIIRTGPKRNETKPVARSGIPHWPAPNLRPGSGQYVAMVFFRPDVKKIKRAPVENGYTQGGPFALDHDVNFLCG